MGKQDGMKVGDWVYFEYQLGHIMEMEQGRVTEFSDGTFRTGGNNLSERCFPLSMPIKQISENYEHWNKRLHEEGPPGLNHPDIHNWLVDHWVETCLHPEDSEWIKTRYEELATFCKDILNKCRDFQLSEVSGIRLGR